MALEVWHGGGTYFTQFEEDAIGSGEGDAMGWGFYFAANRPGGEYFAKFMYHPNNKGYLYRADLMIADDEMLDLDSSFRDTPTAMRCRISRVFRSCEWKYGLHNAYKILRDELGNDGASMYLREEGVMALRSYEDTKPSHGDTYLVLDNSRIVIQEVFELDIQPHELMWRPLSV